MSMHSVLSTILVYASRAKLICGLYNNTSSLYKPYRVYLSLTETHPRSMQAVPYHTAGLYMHTSVPFKPQQAHPKSIQAVLDTPLVYEAMPSTALVYISTPQVYTIRARADPRSIQSVAEQTSGLYKHTPDLYKPYRVHPSSKETHHRSMQTVPSTLQIYTSRSEYTVVLQVQVSCLCKPYHAHPRSMQAKTVSSTP